MLLVALANMPPDRVNGDISGTLRPACDVMDKWKARDAVVVMIKFVP